MAIITKRVTWNPVSVSNFWPADQTMKEGRTDIYSAIPTLTEINLGSATGLNQIIAELRRRQDHESIALSSYFPTGTTLSKAFIVDLQTKINAVRTSQGSAAFAFTNFEKIASQGIKELRDALDAWKITFTALSGSHDGYLRRLSTTNEYPPLGTITTFANLIRQAGASGSTSGGAQKTQFKGFMGIDVEAGYEFFTSYPATVSMSRQGQSVNVGTFNALFYDQGAGWGSLDIGDWSITPGTLRHTLAVSANMGGGFDSFTVPVGSLTPGSPLYFFLDTDLSPTFGPINNQSTYRVNNNGEQLVVEGFIP